MILRYAATAGSLLACNDLFAVLEDRKKWHWVTIFTSIDHTGQFKRKWGCPHLRTRKVISSQNFWGFLDGFLRVSTVDDWHLAVVDKSVYPPYKLTSANSVFLKQNEDPCQMASTIFWRVIRNDEHLHLPLGWHPAIEPPLKGSPLKGDFPNTYQPHKVHLWGSIFKGSPELPRGYYRHGFPLFASAKTHPFRFEVTAPNRWSFLCSDTGSLWEVSLGRWCHGGTMSNPAMPIWKSLRGGMNLNSHI